MMIEIIVALLVGIIFGTFTGLFPGIHINLVAAGLLAGIGYFAGIENIFLVVFVVAMAITHTFIDFIPSVFLGAPEEDSFLAVLPGHQLLKEGRGFEAIVLTLFGSLTALPIILIFSFIFIFALPSVFELFRVVMPYVLIFASLYLVFREENFLSAGVVFILAGFLGLFVFNLPVREPLLPLLTGLFGISALVVSLKDKIVIPKQKIVKIKDVKLDKSGFFRGSFAAAVVASSFSFLPGMGSGHAAIVGSELMGKKGEDKRSFLFLVGAINTIVMALSFVTIYAIGKTRSGAAVAVSKLLGEISFENLTLIIVVVFISGIIAFFIGIWLARIFSRNINKINYGKLSLFIIFILLAVNLVLSNFLGLVVLVTGSALGVFCITSGIRRVNLMGSLLLPTIVLYLIG